LRATGPQVGADEIDRAVDDFRAKWTANNRWREGLFANDSGGEEALRQQVAWELSWRKYVDSHLTDALLKAHFDAHRRDFDGTEVRAGHILLRPPGNSDATSRAALVRKAKILRQQIVAGRITFDEAAKAHSAAPSRTRGGDLGFIPRHGLMAESFSQAAFALDKGTVSPPVVTRFGVHLIRVTDVKPGAQTWTDARRELAVAVGHQLFREMALELRKKASVKFTGAVPYLKPGTGQLMLPNRPARPEPAQKKPTAAGSEDTRRKNTATKRKP
jgi:parvulin-like peptidyl-prolyl isomerase